MGVENGAELELLRPGSERGHSSSSLSRDTKRGLLLRLRPGVFVRPGEWESAPLWVRHRAAAAAAGLSIPSAVLCRETALAIHGVPLLRVPREVQLRTTSRGMVGTSKVRVPSNGEVSGFPVRRIGPPASRRFPGDRARTAYQAGTGAVARMRLAVPGLRFSDGSRPKVTAEALPFVLLDTLPRITFESAVVALDAALAGRYGCGVAVDPDELIAAEGWLWSQSAQARWRSTLSFADPRAESPGESRSRVVIDQLGFVAPRLQTEVRLTGGRRRRLDFDWDAAGIIGEFDGKTKYQTESIIGAGGEASVYWEEKWREDEIEEATGKRFVRWRWMDLDQPKRLERRLLLKGVPKR